MFGATKFYWWLIALGIGITVVFLLERGSIFTLLIATAISGIVFTADPEQVIVGGYTNE